MGLARVFSVNSGRKIPDNNKTKTSRAIRGWLHMINLMIAEDNDIVRDGLVSILANEPDMIVIAVASNGRKAQEAIIGG